MPGVNDTMEHESAQNQGQQPPAAPPADPPPADPPPDDHDAEPRSGVINMSSQKLKERLNRQSAAAVRQKEKALDEEAQAHGFDSHEAMLEWVEKNRAPKQRHAQPPAPTAGGDPPAAVDPPDGDDPAQRKQDAADRLEKERHARIREERKRKQLQREKDQLEVHHQLERAAWQAGITDVEYAVHTLRKKIATLSDEELQKFDEVEYFRKLREDKPYLAGEHVQLATTGNGGGHTPPPPKPGQGGGGKEVDARKMSDKEFKEYLRGLGIRG